MALHNVSPVREQIRAEMLAALANGALMTATELYAHCPSATESTEIARIAHDMRRTGKLETGEQVIHPLGMKVNTYRLPTTEDPRIEAAKVTNAAPKIMPTRQPAIKRKPAPGHPFAAPIRPQAAHDSLPRVTRDLPSHLTTQAPPAPFMADPLSYVPDPEAAARRLPLHLQTQEKIMPEAPADYVTDPDAFTLEPSALEALEGVDSDLAQALFAMSQMDDVGEITQAIAKKHCQCAKITAPPKMPSGFKYSLFSTEIHSEDDDSYMCFETGGPESGTITLSARGDMTFDLDEINMIPEVAAFLNSLHVSE